MAQKNPVGPKPDRRTRRDRVRKFDDRDQDEMDQAERPDDDAQKKAAREEMYKRFETIVSLKKRDSIAGRAASGIEDIWLGDEEFYEGYDDANRHEFRPMVSKPTEGRNSPLTGRSATGDTQRKPSGSTVFPNITGSFVDHAAAKLADILMPSDDKDFELEPTPIAQLLDDDDELRKILAPGPQQAPQGLMGAMGSIGGMGASPALPGPEGMPPAPPPQGMQPQPQMPVAQAMMEMPPDRLGQVIDRVKKINDEAKRRMDAAEMKFDDWLQESDIQAQKRIGLHDAARIGTGILKGPFPVKVVHRVTVRNNGTVKRISEVKTQPASKCVSPWNCFPDYPACGENIQKGNHHFERDFISAKGLADLKGGVGPSKYLDDVIDEVLLAGPKSKNQTEGNTSPDQMQNIDTKTMFEIWYGYMTISGQELAACGCEVDEDRMTDMINVLITTVNDRIIKAVPSPIPDGSFPYDYMPWERRKGMPWGKGVSRKGRTAQRQLVAASRNLMDNAGAAGKPIKVSTSDVQQDGDPWTYKARSDTVADVTKAMQFFEIPMIQPELMAIIEMAKQDFELAVGLPRVMLGMLEQPKGPETLGARTIANNNGATVLRGIARNSDDYWTVPHLKRYYEWGLEYDDDDSWKGDLNVRARGSSALVERALQEQQMPTVVQLSLNPAFGLDPELCAKAWLKSQRYDVKSLEMSAEKKAALAQQQQPTDPRILAAQIKAETDKALKQMDLQDSQAERQHEAQQNDLDRQIEKMIAEIQGQLGAAQLTIEEQAALNDAKVTLTGLSMKLKSQKELSELQGRRFLTGKTMDSAEKQKDRNITDVTPKRVSGNVPNAGSGDAPIEPPGRAKPGMAFVG